MELPRIELRAEIRPFRTTRYLPRQLDSWPLPSSRNPAEWDPRQMTEVTQLLHALDRGDPEAAAQLLPLVYDELRRLAAARLAAEPSGNTLQPTALVHEAYLRLVRTPEGDRWDHCGHFFAAAAEAMRRILIENARRKRRQKRAGDRGRVGMIDVTAPPAEWPADDMLALDEALAQLAGEDATKA